MLVILFGLSGAGKNFVANVFKSQFNVFHWDADELLTQDMLSCIRNHEPFTQEMRDNYFKLVLKKIDKLCLEHEHLVVTQAFYKDKNRKIILSKHPDSLFIHISVKAEVLEQRLRERNNLVDNEYAQQISSSFEPPTHPHVVLDNNGDTKTIIQQLMNIPDLEPMMTRASLFCVAL